MHYIKRLRPSPAMIVAIIALVLSLGGTSYAAIVLPAGSVGTKQIKKNAVVSSKVKNESLTTQDVKNESLTTSDVKDGSLTTADISEASLSTLGRVAIASNSVNVAASSSTRVAVVTLSAPTTGFVLVNGWVDAAYPNARWAVRVWDDGGGDTAHSPYFNCAIATGGEMTASNTAVFPVAAGSHNFSVRVEANTSTVAFNAYGTITAQFVPYNGAGTKAIAAQAKSQGPSQPLP
jgi:hypothetical protein